MGRELTDEEMDEIVVMGERLTELAREVDADVISVHGPNCPSTPDRKPYCNVHANWHPEHVEDRPNEQYRAWAAWDHDGEQDFRYIHGEERS